MTLHLTHDEFDDDRHMFGDQAAQLLGVKPGTIRVWAHRGKLATVGYIINSHDLDEGEGDRYAIYDRKEVESLAAARGIVFTDHGATLWRVEDELGITFAQAEFLAATGDLKHTGRDAYSGHELYDLSDFARERGITLRSVLREKTSVAVPESLRRLANERERREEENSIWSRREEGQRLQRLENMIEDAL